MRALIVERVGPLVTVQDRGRPGLARFGVPASGPLDRGAFAAAIAAVGGDDDAALEIPLGSAAFRAEGALLISIDGEAPRHVEGAFTVERSPRAVRYLAVRGGIMVPRVLGARATLPNAGLGGLEGRALRRGDRLLIGDGGGTPRLGRTLPLCDAIAVVPTHDADAAAIERLTTTTFAIDARSNRVGVRLAGPAIEHVARELPSRPLVVGAVQLPPDGHPIVIGPDGPTTGGYPVIAVVTREGRDQLARLRPGAAARFTIA